MGRTSIGRASESPRSGSRRMRPKWENGKAHILVCSTSNTNTVIVSKAYKNSITEQMNGYGTNTNNGQCFRFPLPCLLFLAGVAVRICALCLMAGTRHHSMALTTTPGHTDISIMRMVHHKWWKRSHCHFAENNNIICVRMH